MEVYGVEIMVFDKKEYNKKYQVIYRLANKEKLSVYNKSWRSNNKERVRFLARKSQVIYRLKHALKVKERKRIYRLNNIKKDKIQKKEYNSRLSSKKRANYLRRFKRKNDNLYRLNNNISCNVRFSLNKFNYSKIKGWEKDLGYTRLDVKNHLEKQFDKNMSWDNQGKYWQIDHIIPLSWFKTKDQLIKHGWALKNLQPLESNLNREKHNCFVGNPTPKYETIYLGGNRC